MAMNFLLGAVAGAAGAVVVADAYPGESRTKTSHDMLHTRAWMKITKGGFERLNEKRTSIKKLCEDTRLRTCTPPGCEWFVLGVQVVFIICMHS